MTGPRIAIGLGIALLFISVSIGVRQSVQAEKAVENGPWHVNVERPSWWPDGYAGSLHERLAAVPSEVPLGALDWQAEVRRSLLQSPWIDEVRGIRRHGAEVLFEAQIVRPIFGVRVPEGTALVDSHGVVLDIAPKSKTLFGIDVPEAWGMPVYEPLDDVQCTVGERLAFEEAEELASLVHVLWSAHVYGAASSKIPQITSTVLSDRGRVFRLRGDRGIVLDWGRAPESERVSLISNEMKVANLSEALRRWRDLRPSSWIELFRKDHPVIDMRSL